MIKKEEHQISELGFILKEFGFVDARNQDDSIDFVWRNESKKLKVSFWIPFWKNYKIDENFMVTFILTNDIDNKYPVISKAFEFKKLNGNDLSGKMSTLFLEVVEIIN